MTKKVLVVVLPAPKALPITRLLLSAIGVTCVNELLSLSGDGKISAFVRRAEGESKGSLGVLGLLNKYIYARLHTT